MKHSKKGRRFVVKFRMKKSLLIKRVFARARWTIQLATRKLVWKWGWMKSPKRHVEKKIYTWLRRMYK